MLLVFLSAGLRLLLSDVLGLAQGAVKLAQSDLLTTLRLLQSVDRLHLLQL